MNKKIALINYTLNFGGAERFISEMANYLVTQNDEVFIILLDKTKSDYEIHKSVKIIHPKFNKPRRKIFLLLYIIYLYFYLRKTIVKVNPDSILNTAFPVFILAAIGRLKRVNMSIRANPEKTVSIEGLNVPLFIRKYFYRRANIIIAQTSFASNFLKKQFPDNKIITIPNYLGNFDFSNLPDEKPNLKKVLFIGRLIKSKGVEYLIKAFATINDEIWQLIIVGDGPDGDNLKRIANESNCANRIYFCGLQNDVMKYYQNSEIFAFPSFSEGFPNALLEAMAAPCACISFNCKAGPEDIIMDGVNGVLVETGDLEIFTKKLKILMSDEDMRDRLKKEAVKTRQDYSLEKIGKLYLDILY